jgi:hypothetical protein
MGGEGMNLRVWSLVAVLAFVPALPGWAGPQEEAIDAARTSAREWLALLDDHQYEETWHQAGELLKAAVSQDEWAKRWSVTLGPLGKAESRRVRSSDYSTTLPGAPDGEYVVVKFDTTFASKQTALEQVTLRKEDGAWKISGYWIR